jgi:hypothetical protein
MRHAAILDLQGDVLRHAAFLVRQQRIQALAAFIFDLEVIKEGCNRDP